MSVLLNEVDTTSGDNENRSWEVLRWLRATKIRAGTHRVKSAKIRRLVVIHECNVANHYRL